MSDALTQLQHAAARGPLKQQLKVVFVGEVGVDEGGVQRVCPLHCNSLF